MFKTILKDSGIIFIYLLVTMIFGFAIEQIEPDSASILRFILGLVNVLVFMLVLIVYYYAYGRQASKIKHTNDIARRYFLETGEYRELKIDKEYNLLKPLFMALVSCVPLIIFIMIYGVFDLTGTVSSGAGVNAFLTAILFILTLYRGFLVPIRGLAVTVSIYWSLIYIPICIGTVMLSYYLGHLRSQRDLKQIRKTHEEIYGTDK
ncbi:MAG: hypothetical protein E7342_02175 [Clostridiales bacterium]|nr:hypothetical protein [Clostridiales bacterium]